MSKKRLVRVWDRKFPFALLVDDQLYLMDEDGSFLAKPTVDPTVLVGDHDSEEWERDSRSFYAIPDYLRKKSEEEEQKYQKKSDELLGQVIRRTDIISSPPENFRVVGRSFRYPGLLVLESLLRTGGDYAFFVTAHPRHLEMVTKFEQKPKVPLREMSFYGPEKS